MHNFKVRDKERRIKCKIIHTRIFQTRSSFLGAKVQQDETRIGGRVFGHIQENSCNARNFPLPIGCTPRVP